MGEGYGAQHMAFRYGHVYCKQSFKLPWFKTEICIQNQVLRSKTKKRYDENRTC